LAFEPHRRPATLTDARPAKYELGERRLDVLEFHDVAAAIGFDPSTLLQALRNDAADAPIQDFQNLRLKCD